MLNLEVLKKFFTSRQPGKTATANSAPSKSSNLPSARAPGMIRDASPASRDKSIYQGMYGDWNDMMAKTAKQTQNNAEIDPILFVRTNDPRLNSRRPTVDSGVWTR